MIEEDEDMSTQPAGSSRNLQKSWKDFLKSLESDSAISGAPQGEGQG